MSKPIEQTLLELKSAIGAAEVKSGYLKAQVAKLKREIAQAGLGANVSEAKETLRKMTADSKRIEKRVSKALRVLRRNYDL
jgi:phage shock protein A